jgi:hypothetical protein
MNTGGGGEALSSLAIGELTMLSTLVVVLVVLWALGLATSYTLGGLIHILLAVALIAVLVRVIQGRNPLAG